MEYKDFIFISSSFDCDKSCPYCIAKIGSLLNKVDDLNSLRRIISELEQNGDTFEYFVFSGNGEPSLYDYAFLKEVKEIVANTNIFKDYRIQTSGSLFFYNEKWDLFKNWLIEITRVHRDFMTDKEILNYKSDYMTTSNFHNSRIRLNHALLNSNLLDLDKDIKDYFDEFENIETIALKILDVYKNNLNCKQSVWIQENAVRYSEKDFIFEIMNKDFEFLEYVFNNFVWYYGRKMVSMYYKTEKIKNNLMFYGDSLI